MNTMTTMIAAQYVTMKHILMGRVNEERGATALEYVGMILVAAMVVAAVAGALSTDTIGGAVEGAVEEITSIGGE